MIFPFERATGVYGSSILLGNFKPKTRYVFKKDIILCILLKISAAIKGIARVWLSRIIWESFYKNINEIPSRGLDGSILPSRGRRIRLTLGDSVLPSRFSTISKKHFSHYDNEKITVLIENALYSHQICIVTFVLFFFRSNFSVT